MSTGEGCYKWRGDVNAEKFGLNNFGILMMGSNFPEEFVATSGFLQRSPVLLVCESVNKMFVELLRYSYPPPKLLHVEKITFLIELGRIYIISTEEISHQKIPIAEKSE